MRLKTILRIGIFALFVGTIFGGMSTAEAKVKTCTSTFKTEIDCQLWEKFKKCATKESHNQFCEAIRKRYINAVNAAKEESEASKADPGELNVPFSNYNSIDDFKNESGSKNLLEGFSIAIFKIAYKIILPLAVLMVIIGGVQIMLGGASSESATQGKELIKQALAGIVLLTLTGLILNLLLPWFYVL